MFLPPRTPPPSSPRKTFCKEVPKPALKPTHPHLPLGSSPHPRTPRTGYPSDSLCWCGFVCFRHTIFVSPITTNNRCHISLLSSLNQNPFPPPHTSHWLPHSSPSHDLLPHTLHSTSLPSPSLPLTPHHYLLSSSVPPHLPTVLPPTTVEMQTSTWWPLHKTRIDTHDRAPRTLMTCAIKKHTSRMASSMYVTWMTLTVKKWGLTITRNTPRVLFLGKCSRLLRRVGSDQSRR